MKKVVKYIAVLISTIIFLFLLSFLTLTVLIQIPKFQTWAVQKASILLSDKLGSKVSVGSVDIRFIKTIELQQIYLEDKHQDTLLFANIVRADLLLGKSLYSQINTLKENKIYVGNVVIDGLKFNGYRTETDSLYNFSNIIDALKSDKKKEKKKKSNTSLDLKVNNLLLTNIDLKYDDQYGGTGLKITAKKLDAHINKLDLNKLLVDVDYIEINKPIVALTLYNRQKKEKKKTSKPFAPQNLGLLLKVGKTEITDGQYLMDMLNRKPIKVGDFNISNMNIAQINTKIKDFGWDTTGLYTEIKYLNTILANNIKIKDISGDVLLDNKTINLSDANIQMNQSEINGDYALLFMNNWKDFSHFAQDVILDANIKESKVYRNDVLSFVPSIKKYLPEKADLIANVRGPLDNLKIKTINVQAGSKTKLDITGNIKGLPKIKQTLFDLYVNNIQTNVNDLGSMLPFLKMPKQVANAGNVKFNGSFKGYIDDFYTKGNLITDNLGSIGADIHLQFPKGNAPKYQGKIIAEKLNLAELTGNQKLLGTIDLDMNALGNGFSLKNINTKLIGKVKNFYLNGFVFNEIDINGILDKKKFTGNAFYDDGCFLFDFNGLADFNDKIPNYNFNIQLKNANLRDFKLAKDSVIISMNGAIKASGNNINNINGIAKFDNIIIQNEKNMLTLSDLSADMQSLENFKHYIIKSNEIDIDLKGNFNPLTLVPSAKVYLSKYSTLIKPSEKELKKNQLQDIKAKIFMHSDFGGIFKVFLPKLNYTSELNINGGFNNSVDYFDVSVRADSINYDKIALAKINLATYNQGKELLSEFSVKNIKSGKVSFDDINLDLNSSLEQILTSISVEPNTSKNGFQMVSTLNFTNDTTIAKILDSKIKLNDKYWVIEKGNSVMLYDSIFETQGFKIVQDQQAIYLQNGKNTLSDLKLTLNNINLADIAQIIDTTGSIKRGDLTGTINLKNVLKNPEIHTDLVINDFKIIDYEAKYIGLDAIYGRGGKKIAEFGGVLDDPNYQLAFNGSYDMQVKGKEKLDVDALIDKLDLSFLQTLLKNEISVKNTYVKGNVRVSGSLKNIVLDGQATLLDTATIKMRYLGTTFRIPKNEVIALNKSGFDFGTLTVFDEIGNNASVSGRLLHNSFKNFTVDKVVFNTPLGYHFMHTQFADNQDFYGDVFASGNANINGPFNDLKIEVNASTLNKTVFNLPVSGKNTKANYSYITFFNPNDTTKVIQDKIKFNGISILMNIIATPDAEANIILDQSTGDKISARGSGNLTMNLDKNGKLDLNGTYTITNGNYNFKFQNIISKIFKIKNGSTITFAGDPMNAMLDINAVYNVNASIRNLLNTSDSLNKNILNRSIPIDLNLLITNTLSKPDINFLVSPSNNSLDAQTQDIIQMLERINNNKTEVYNQAFGLLLFNGFIPFVTGGLGEQQFSGASNSFTQFFTQQISNLFTKGLEQLGLKGASLDVLLKDIESKESRQFGFSYKQELFNSRLIFTVGGNVNFGTTTTDINGISTNSNNSTFTSDFVLEYLITADGRIRLKTFAKTGDFDIINQDRLRTGGAISFQKDFDSLKELFTPNKKSKTSVIKK